MKQFINCNVYGPKPLELGKHLLPTRYEDMPRADQKYRKKTPTCLSSRRQQDSTTAQILTRRSEPSLAERLGVALVNYMPVALRSSRPASLRIEA